jgi:hypothetical protein
VPKTTELDPSIYSSFSEECAQLSGTSLAPRPSNYRLRSWNEVDYRHTPLNGSLLSRMSLGALNAWFALKHVGVRFVARRFPRSEAIVGHPSPSHRITGRIIFERQRDDADMPMHHMPVELWGRTIWGAHRKLQVGRTDRDGRYSLTYDLDYCRRWPIRSLWVGVYHLDHGPVTSDAQAHPARVQLTKVRIPKRDLIGLTYRLNTIRVSHWEYRDDTALPRVVIRDHDTDAPDRYPPGRLEAIEHTFIPIELIKAGHLKLLRSAPERLSHARIQSDYPTNLTRFVEQKVPGLTRNDAWFGERMMNGMFGADLDRDPREPELFWIHHHWSSYDKDISQYALPDVDIWLRLKDNGYLTPVRIALTGALRAADVGDRTTHVFTNDDGAKWVAAKRAARVSAALHQELAHHFAGTHLNMEQYAIAAFRNLRLSPVARLLKPHLRGVVLINHSADRMLMGNGYISTACALTAKGLDQVVTNVMGTLDWQHFRPREPISPAHRYAHVANLYWDVVYRYVSDYLDAPEVKRRTLETWFELYRFSEDAVNHSVPSFLCHYLRGALLDRSGKPRDGHGHGWYQTRPRMNLHEERPVVAGRARAVSPITRDADGRDADAGAYDNLKQACAYIIYHATFGHTWGNALQYEDIGEVMYCSLGIRYGSTPDGILGPERDEAIAPDLLRSTQMMWWSNMLARTRHGMVMANEEGDVLPDFISALEAQRSTFAELGFDIDLLQTGINI